MSNLPKTLDTATEIIKAEIRCFFYSLFCGMWRGEGKFTAWDSHNRIIFIGMMTGSPLQGNAKITKVFYAPDVKDKDSLIGPLDMY